MAKNKKSITDAEKAAMRCKGLDWRFWELVWRGETTFIVRNIGTQELQTVHIEPRVYG